MFICFKSCVALGLYLNTTCVLSYIKAFTSLDRWTTGQHDIVFRPSHIEGTPHFIVDFFSFDMTVPWVNKTDIRNGYKSMITRKGLIW